MSNSLLLLGLIFVVIYMLNNKLLKKFIGGDELDKSDTKLVLENKSTKMKRREFLKMLDENNKPTDLLDIKENDDVGDVDKQLEKEYSIQKDELDDLKENDDVGDVDKQLEKEYSIQKDELDDLKEKHSKAVRQLNIIKKQQTKTRNELEGYRIMNYYDLNNDKQINLKEIVTVLNSDKK